MRKTKTKREIVETISEKTGFTQLEVKRIIEAFIDEIKLLFKKKFHIELRGFGTFFPYFKKSRKLNIFGTDRVTEMKERWILKFKASPKLFLFKG